MLLGQDQVHKHRQDEQDKAEHLRVLPLDVPYHQKSSLVALLQLLLSTGISQRAHPPLLPTHIFTYNNANVNTINKEATEKLLCFKILDIILWFGIRKMLI